MPDASDPDDLDPFRHHPGLRGRIADPETSFFRTITTESVAAMIEARGGSAQAFHPDDVREALRHATLSGHDGGDLWVFAYGSLMWDPGLRFTQVRRAHVADHARRFILRDTEGGRGTRDAPGLMAALDRDPGGPGCDGLAFRIAAGHVEDETRILWQRELIGPAYDAAFVTAQTAAGPVRAVTFVADHAAPMIASDLTHAEQVHLIATGAGFLGTSLEYLTRIADQFDRLGIADPHVATLMRDTACLRGDPPQEPIVTMMCRAVVLPLGRPGISGKVP